MQLKLRVVGGKNDGREIAIAGERFIVGRGEGCHLQPASELVSRRHCEITVENGRFLIVDLGSSNGTLINDKRIEAKTELRSGDRLQIGPLHFQIVRHSSVAVPDPATTVDLVSTRPKLKDSESEIIDWLTDGVTPQVPTVEMHLDETREALPQLRKSESAQTAGASPPTMRVSPVPAPPAAADPKDAQQAASAAIGNVRNSIARNRQR